MRRRPDGSSEDGAAEALPSDPLADLLFTLIAAVLPAILLLAPLVARSRTAVEDSAATARAAATTVPPVTVDGHAAVRILAGADGLRLLDDGGERVPLDRIADAPRLRAALAEARRHGAPLLVIVEPDGNESAFALEPVLATETLADLRELRLATPCAGMRDAKLRRACGAAA